MDPNLKFYFMAALLVPVFSAIPTERRNIYQFGKMIGCLNEEKVITSWDKYDGYGCYCGIGGKGEPVDETDRCCQLHDRCYERVSSSGKCPPLHSYIYIVHYLYKEESCGTPSKKITCAPVKDYRLYHSLFPKCAALVCECDKNGAICFSKAKYNEEYKNYSQDKCQKLN